MTSWLLVVAAVIIISLLTVSALLRSAAVLIIAALCSVIIGLAVAACLSIAALLTIVILRRRGRAAVSVRLVYALHTAAEAVFRGGLFVLWDIGLLIIAPVGRIIVVVVFVHCLSFPLGLLFGQLNEKLGIFSHNALDNDVSVVEMNYLS